MTMVALASNNKMSPCGVHREVDAAIVEIERRVDALERGHAASADEARHVVEEGGVLQPVRRRLRHVGAEIMDFPVARNRQVQRIEFAGRRS